MLKISEVIVVEGKDDISAVKKAVDAEVIQVNGHAIKKKDAVLKLKKAYETVGIIILTDPDYAGESIRKHINEYFPKAKNAFLSREKAIKNKDIGIENAEAVDIINALKKARCIVNNEKSKSKSFFSVGLLYEHNLISGENSVLRRQKLGEILGIGYCNGKQFLSRLINYGITKEDFFSGLKELEK